MGALLFGAMAGASFDPHLKEWRLFADLINDLGLTLDLAAPLLVKVDIVWNRSKAVVDG